jgi:hypothetical protein
VNFLVQATAANITQAAALLADARGLELLMTLHDSLVIQADDKAVEEKEWALREIMEEAPGIILGPLGMAMRVKTDFARAGHSLELDPSDESKFQDVLRWLKEAS